MATEMGIFEVMYNCRAMRRIKPDPVPEEMLLRLIDAANQAPSGSNAQNGRWMVVRDPAQKAKLAELNHRAVTAYPAPNSARPASLPHQTADARARMLAAVVWQAEHFAEIPAHVVACLQMGSPVRDTSSAGAGAGGSIVAIAVFIVIAASSVAIPVIAYLVASERMSAPLESLRAWLVDHNAAVMADLLLVIGVVMIGKGIGSF